MNNIISICYFNRNISPYESIITNKYLLCSNGVMPQWGEGKLLVDLLSSGQLVVCKKHDNPKHPQRDPCQSSGFFLSYNKIEIRSKKFMETLIKFGVEKGAPNRMGYSAGQ